MDTTAQLIDYNTTGAFSKLVTDYISGNKDLAPFYNHPVSIEGIKAAIAARKQYATNRSLLVEALMVQYKEFAIAAMVKTNIDRLLLPNTFTITTAHQPNIFTGPLYFIYKILHAIKLAEQLTSNIPDCNFVPVYYMGSEDADLDELGHIFIKGEKYRWHTTQTGAVGRMKVDKALVKLIDEIAGQILVQPNGAAIIAIMKACYQEGVTIEQATFKLVNELFKDYGLVVLLPDTPLLKKAFIPVIEKELNEGFSYKAVNETAALFPATYKVQASGREINLFYLLDDKRERIEKTTTGFSVNNTTLQYTAKEICTELINHPERFSPNVILRPVFQEVILPNIAFIGGGGELAYWMELKKVFLATGVKKTCLLMKVNC
jgi:bacillithiol synthase